MNAIPRSEWSGTMVPVASSLVDKLKHRNAELITGHFRPASLVALPADLLLRLASALRTSGIDQLYAHQGQAWRAARDGRHFVVATSTASGKSLYYTLSVLASVLESQTLACTYSSL